MPDGDDKCATAAVEILPTAPHPHTSATVRFHVGRDLFSLATRFVGTEQVVLLWDPTAWHYTGSRLLFVC